LENLPSERNLLVKDGICRPTRLGNFWVVILQRYRACAAGKNVAAAVIFAGGELHAKGGGAKHVKELSQSHAAGGTTDPGAWCPAEEHTQRSTQNDVG